MTMWEGREDYVRSFILEKTGGVGLMRKNRWDGEGSRGSMEGRRERWILKKPHTYSSRDAQLRHCHHVPTGCLKKSSPSSVRSSHSSNYGHLSSNRIHSMTFGSDFYCVPDAP